MYPIMHRIRPSGGGLRLGPVSERDLKHGLQRGAQPREGIASEIAVVDHPCGHQWMGDLQHERRTSCKQERPFASYVPGGAPWPVDPWITGRARRENGQGRFHLLPPAESRWRGLGHELARRREAPIVSFLDERTALLSTPKVHTAVFETDRPRPAWATPPRPILANWRGSLPW